MLKSLVKYGFAVLLAVVCFTLIVQMKYSLSLPEYLAYSMPLTQEEKAYLKENKKLVCSIDPDISPYSFINEDTGEPEGMIYDYLRALALEIGIDAEFTYNEGRDSIEALKDGKADMITAFFDKKGSPDYLSAQRLCRIRGVIVSKSDSEYIKNAKNMNGKNIVLVTETYMEDMFLDGIKFTPNTKITRVADTRQALNMLTEKKCDAVVGIESLIRHSASADNMEKDIYISPDPLFDGYMTAGVSTYDTQLLNIVNKGLLKLKKNGIMLHTERKWLGDAAPAVADNSNVKIAQYIMIFCVMAVLFLMFWEGVLNRRIDAKTREINYQKNNLQQVIDSIGSMLVLINKKNRIEFCNRSCREITGLTQEELRRKDVYEIEILSHFLSSLGEGESSGEFFFNGRYYNVRLENIKARKGSILLVCDDCTDKRFAEQKLRQENKMSAVGQLSAGLAHEIRNPLGLIKNYSYILKGYATDEMSKHSLEVIGDSVARINTLIENLLSFSRLSGDKPSKFDIGKSLENIFALEKKKLEKASVDFRLIYPKNTEVYTIEEAIKIISYNLVNNAVEAMEDAKTKTRKLSVKVSVQNNILNMQFRNNGPVISEENLENIFNPFFTTKETGTGLGLYIVSSEIDKLGGSISVTSSEKETSFNISIPMEEVK